MRVKDTVNGREGEVVQISEDHYQVKWDGFGDSIQWTNKEHLAVIVSKEDAAIAVPRPAPGDGWPSKLPVDKKLGPVSFTHRRELLQEATSIITKDRNNSYGDPDQDFARIAELWTTYLGYEVKPHDVAVMMILLKVSRLSWNPSHKDSWLDIAGYAGCGYETEILRRPNGTG